MQLYSIFTHSFDLSQVIDFKQLASILPIDKQKRKIEHTNYKRPKIPLFYLN